MKESFNEEDEGIELLKCQLCWEVTVNIIDFNKI